MIKQLRKRHLQIWTVWALLLPIGILFAWLSIPNQQPVKLLESSPAKLLPEIKQTKEFKNYIINIRGNPENTAWQLEWVNNLPLTYPSALIYQSIFPSGPFDPSLAELVGRIEARGNYVFPLNAGETKNWHFVLYDFIHEKVIDTIIFKL